MRHTIGIHDHETCHQSQLHGMHISAAADHDTQVLVPKVSCVCLLTITFDGLDNLPGCAAQLPEDHISIGMANQQQAALQASPFLVIMLAQPAQWSSAAIAMASLLIQPLQLPCMMNNIT